MNRILVACVGNIFNSDDGFGVEVARELAAKELPTNIVVQDFGIRGRDLAFTLLENWSAVIIVDCVTRGENPGTLFVIEPTTADFASNDGGIVDAHSLDPLNVLRTAHRMGAKLGKVRVVGCEPETIDDGLGLSDAVAAAIPRAVTIIEKVVAEIL